jgi:DNA polymerase-3 subunit epsilon
MFNRFLALDFETANQSRNSACAIALAVVENLEIVKTVSYLIKPPTDYFFFTDLHGISWEDVKDEPSFDKIWKEISPFFSNIDFIAAHNAPFDKSVLKRSCGHYDLKMPEIDFICTYRKSEKMLKLKRFRLNDVSDYFGIELDHHNALSDTIACAKIMIELIKIEKNTAN